MSDEKADLKPCPFCGEAPRFVMYQQDGMLISDYQIFCDNISCPIRPKTYASCYKHQVKEEWNTRYNESEDDNE